MEELFTLTLTYTYRDGSTFSESFIPQTLTKVLRRMDKASDQIKQESNIVDVTCKVEANESLEETLARAK